MCLTWEGANSCIDCPGITHTQGVQIVMSQQAEEYGAWYVAALLLWLISLELVIVCV